LISLLELECWTSQSFLAGKGLQQEEPNQMRTPQWSKKPSAAMATKILLRHPTNPTNNP
jgi:hypothetical protein